MFTGIVEALGTIVAIDREAESSSDQAEASSSNKDRDTPDFIRITVDAPGVTDTLSKGDSLAVNGVCLTDAGHEGTAVKLDVMGETLNRTTLGGIRPGDRVNLERAVQPSQRLGGHIVQGHVDGTARLLSRDPHDKWEVFRFSLPSNLARYVVEKGSIAVSGTSLTISAVAPPSTTDPWFEVSLIPTTMRDTILGSLALDAPVNIEVDIVAKYIERNANVSGYLHAVTDPADQQSK